LSEQCKEPDILPIYTKGDQIHVSNYRGMSQFCSLQTKCIQHYSLKVNNIRRRNYQGPSVWISTYSKHGGKVGIDFIWLRIGTGGKLL